MAKAICMGFSQMLSRGEASEAREASEASIHKLAKVHGCFEGYTANISAVLSTVNCGVTFPTVIWQYSELLMTFSCCGYCHQGY